MKLKLLVLCGLYLFTLSFLRAQNTYLTVSEVSAGFAISAGTQGASVGDHLLIYQYAGAEVTPTGNDAGQLADLEGAGRFALTRVARTGGDTLYFSQPISGTFDPAVTQIVVDDGSSDRTVGALRAAPFDGRVGGILFVAASGKLSLTGVLSANGAGFRGGQGIEVPGSCSFLTVANAMTYPAGDFRGSGRGEGIASSTITTALGRAPLANGGGGGNDHNTGGGGGANTSTGGEGATNIVNSLFLCRGQFPGFGGYPMPAADDRVYFGGGGGAGHANNTDAASGGRGGGLVVLWAPEVSFGAGAGVESIGDTPKTISGDGAGGGGAGGSLLIYANTIDGSPVVDLRGGDGGNTENLPDRCFGPGGGGGGGRLLVTGNQENFTPRTELSGGEPGKRLGSEICSPTDSPGGGGGNGEVQEFEDTRPVSAFVLSEAFLCASQTLYLEDQSRGADTVLYHFTPNDSGLSIVQEANRLAVSFTGETSGQFTVTQLLVAGADTLTGAQRTFTVGGLPAADSLRVREAGDSVVLEVVGARYVDQFTFDLGNGVTVTTGDPAFTYRYPEAGTYRPSVLLVSASCGQVILAGQAVSVAEPLRAIIQEKDPSGCAPLTIDPFDFSRGEYSGRRWDFPGGEPGTSTEERPVVTYTRPGRYTATLTLTGTAGGRDSVATMIVNVFDTPVAGFDFTVAGSTVTFSNLSDADSESEWSFGDGNSSSERNPVHTYLSGQTYPVTLIARGSYCSDTLRQEIFLETTAVRDLRQLGVAVYPNPTTGRLFIEGPAVLAGLYDPSGRKIMREGSSVDLSDLPAGVYLLHLIHGADTYTIPVVRR